jgi:hypothetical protein
MQYNNDLIDDTTRILAGYKYGENYNGFKYINEFSDYNLILGSSGSVDNDHLGEFNVFFADDDPARYPGFYIASGGESGNRKSIVGVRNKLRIRRNDATQETNKQYWEFEMKTNNELTLTYYDANGTAHLNHTWTPS